MPQSTEAEVLKVLEEGGSLRYFFLEGGVAVHGKDGAPLRTVTCSTETFLKLREEKKIDQTEKLNTGYPYYANNVKSAVYRLTK